MTTEPIAINEDLERAIAADPAAVANYVVYADWLTERGDPRGELITCTLPDAKNRAERASEILRAHARYFLGTLVDEQELAWQCGFIHAARLMTADALKELLHLPSGKFLQWLTVGAFTMENDINYNTIYAILAKAGPRPTMRSLFFGDMEAIEHEVSWVDGGSLRTLAGLYPNLEELKLRAGLVDMVGGLDYPKLRSLILISGGTSRETLREIAKTSFPELRHLEIWFGSSDYGANTDVEDVMPILEGKNLPKLESLGLRNCEYTDELCDALIEAPIVDRITRLDLSKGCMTDEGAQSLMRKATFQSLRTLDVGDNYLQTAVAELREGITRAYGEAIEVTGDYQKVADDISSRYVSLGE